MSKVHMTKLDRLMAVNTELLKACMSLIAPAEFGSSEQSPPGYWDDRIDAARATMAEAIKQQEKAQTEELGRSAQLLKNAASLRFSACTNACKGISTEALEGGVVSDLVKALFTFVKCHDAGGFIQPDDDVLIAGRAAIAKVTGQREGMKP